MDHLKQVWDQEPVVVLGIIGSILVFAFQQFAGKGIISADTSQNIQNLVTALIPLVASLLARTQVTPA